MKIILKKIVESEFRKLDIPILFEDKSLDRNFGVVSDGKKEYKIGWQSENIEPVVKKINPLLYSIGIDLIFVIFEFSTGKIVQNFSLDYYFYDTAIFNNALYIITQLEIIKIDNTSLVVVNTYSLPDYFESIEFNEGIIVVRCINNETIDIG